MQVQSYLMFHHRKKRVWKGTVLSFPVPSRALPPVCGVPLLPVHSYGLGEQDDQDKK